jgi:hypothetical protein
MLEGSGAGLVDPDPDPGGQKTRESVRIRIRYTGYTVLNVPLEFVIICRQHPVEARAHRTFEAVLRIRDVYPGSRILIFTHPGSLISYPGSKNSNKRER